MGSFNRTAVATLVERTSRYTLLVDLPEGHGAIEVAAGLLEVFANVPTSLRRSLTWDQGREMTEWETVDELIACYFAHPHAPWERGTNEQNNGVIRRWLPKGTNIHRSHHDLMIIQHDLNTMPRRLHDWRSADQV